tara:strand:- start:63 stop:743 length:681 start_codon:yes stop_codon:yes gene_type:complete
MSDLEEVSDDELLSQSEGEIELSTNESEQSSEQEEEMEEQGDTIDSEEENEEKEHEDEEGEEDDEEEDPWLSPPEEMKNISSNLPELSDDDEDTDSDYDEDELKKIDRSNNSEILLKAHPEIQQINYKELSALSKTTRDKDGSIIDPMHRTLPILTRYEKAKVLGLRAKQINNGSEIFVKVGKDIIDGHTIALLELKSKKIPFIIKRPMPNGYSEYWKLKDLELID